MVDSPDDTTIPVVDEATGDDPRIRVVVNTHGRGPAQAIRYGFDVAAAPTVVVTMADGSDDPRQIDALTELVERGVVVAAGSRYMAGWPADRRTALQAAPLPHRRHVAPPVREHRHARCDELVQGVQRRLRPRP